MKRYLALLMAVIMILSLGAMAFAANDGSIEIKNSLPGRVYSIYKIFDATLGEDGKVAYTYDGTLVTNDYFTQDSAKNIRATENAVDENGNLHPNAIEFLSKLLDGKEPKETKTANESTLTFSSLEYGYYLVDTDFEGTTKAVSVDTTMPEVTIIDKNNAPSWDNEDGGDEDDPNPGKVILEKDADGNTVKVTENSVNLGDKVDFSIAVNAYSYVLNEKKEAKLVTYYYITDTLTDGFDPAEDITVKVYEVGEGGTYEEEGTDITDTCVITSYDNKFDITVPFGENYGSKAKIEVTYSATVKEDGEEVDIGKHGNLNTANFTYSTDDDPSENPPYDPNNEKKTTTYVYALAIEKIDAETKEKLAEAHFSIDNIIAKETTVDDDVKIYLFEEYAGEGKTPTDFVTNANGFILLVGIKEGTYTVTETKAPDGYNKLTAPISVEVNKNTASEEVELAVIPAEAENEEDQKISCQAKSIEVENSSGVELPSTGGFGTTLFIAIGAAVFAMTMVILVAKKRTYNAG